MSVNHIVTHGLAISPNTVSYMLTWGLGGFSEPVEEGGEGPVKPIVKPIVFSNFAPMSC